MSLSPEAQALVTKLDAVHERAASGDREAIHFIKSLKTRALSGEAQALRVYNTLAVIHWKKQRGGDYEKAEAYYNRLKAGEPTAMAKLQTLLNRVRSGDPDSVTLFRVLKSIHGKQKSSAFSDGPGAPRIGGYGLPEQHRPGIVIGGIIDSLSPFAYQNVFGGHQPSTQHRIGHGGGYPMNQPHLYGRPRVSGFRVPNPQFSGVGDAQPLTASALANLIGLMVRVRAMPMATQILSSFSTLSVGPTSTSFSTVPAPSGINTATPQTLSQQLAQAQAANALKPATAAEMQAFKTANSDPQASVTMGQLVANGNPFMNQVRATSIGDDSEKAIGFYHAIVTSLGNTQAGPGQDAQRDRMLLPTTSYNSGANGRRLYGFMVGRDMMYKAQLAGRPIFLPAAGGKVLGRSGSPMTEAQRTALLANQGICNQAKSALDRGSPAAPSLISQCSATRRNNVMSGLYFADAMSPNDPAYRVALTDAGEATVSRNPQLQQFRATLPVSRQRGFTMAMGVRAGKMDPAFPAFVRPGLSQDPELLAGFDLGMSMQ